MKNLIKLKPISGEFSEIRGLEDLLALLKTRTPTGRMALLQRLNLDDIETPQDLLSIIDVLTTKEEREQFYALLDTPFLKRILPLSSELKSHDPKSFNRVGHLITTDSLVCLYPIIEQYTLQQIRYFLEALSTKLLKKMVISVVSNVLVKKLSESLTEGHVKKLDEPLSFSKWPTDYYHEATSWCDDYEDDHADRCLIIIRKIEDALYIGLLLEDAEQTIYFETLFSLLDRIIHSSNDLNYLLRNISKNNQPLLMTLIIKRGIDPQQIEVLSQDEYVFTQWRQCTFFNRNIIKNQQNSIEHSSFSDEQVSKIQSQIMILQKEINSIWPFPNKDRKIEKVKGLRALLIKSTQMNACIAIEQIEKEYPEIRKGSISTRTAQLLNSIQEEQQFSKQLAAN